MGRTKLASLIAAWSLLAALLTPSLLNAADEPVPEPRAPAEGQAPPPDQPPAQRPSEDPAELPAQKAPEPPAPAAERPQPAPEPAQAQPEPPAQAEQPAAEQAPVAAAGEEQATDEKPDAKAAAGKSVSIKDFEFGPGSITINVGDSVTWTNRGPTEHTATANDGSFDTGLLDVGKSSSHTFSKAGNFSYICTPHPFMTGTVKVVAASGGGDQGTSGGGAGGQSGSGNEDIPSATGEDTTANGSQLANTGSDSLALALLGALLLVAGVAVRQRVGNGHSVRKNV